MRGSVMRTFVMHNPGPTDRGERAGYFHPHHPPSPQETSMPIPSSADRPTST
jgi:hypothetical protein